MTAIGNDGDPDRVKRGGGMGHPVLRRLARSTVELWGTKADGTTYGPRMLMDLTFNHTRLGQVLVTGLEPGRGFRSLHLSGIERMDVVSLSHAPQSEARSSEGGVSLDPEWRWTGRFSIPSDQLEALGSELAMTLLADGTGG